MLAYRALSNTFVTVNGKALMKDEAAEVRSSSQFALVQVLILL